MRMSAFRWAKQHDIELKYAHECVGRGYDLRIHLYCKPASGAIQYSYNDVKSLIAVGKGYKSQLRKNLSVWHEIGHYIDYRQNLSKVWSMNILKKEARAWVKAIKLMKKYNQWKDKYLYKALEAYNTYVRDYPFDKSYAHLIIKEASRK